MEKYQNQLQFLRHCLKELDCDVGDNVVIWLVLNSIREYDIRKFLVRDLNNKTLTWEKLILEISTEVAKEITRTTSLLLLRTKLRRKIILTQISIPFMKLAGNTILVEIINLISYIPSSVTNRRKLILQGVATC
jgi:hypothetical protein